MKKNTFSLKVQGTLVTGAIINGFARRVGSIDDILSVWANAATLQAVAHGNKNWLDQLFAVSALRLKSNELSKQGKEVLSYIQAHCPRVVWNKDNQSIGLTKLAKESILADHFLVPGATAVSDSVILHRDKFYAKHGDFALTFQGFKNLAKPEAEEKPEPSVTAKSLTGQLTKALEAHGKERLVGTIDELMAAAVKAKELFMLLDAAHTAAMDAKLKVMQESGVAATHADALDLERVDQANKTLSAKSKAAPGPVAVKEAV